MSLHVLGIRHHGPGSARSLLLALEELQPDIILVEGPPDAEAVLHLAAHANMQPPVAMLIYVPDNPSQAVYYPFAVFSPEWQAINYGLKKQIPVRFMDLPQAHRLAVTSTKEASPLPSEPPTPAALVRRDPLSYLAQIAGYADGERWWEHMVEHRRDKQDLFEAVLEVMSALRLAVAMDALPPIGTRPLDLVEPASDNEVNGEVEQPEEEEAGKKRKGKRVKNNVPAANNSASLEPSTTDLDKEGDTPIVIGEAHREAYMRQTIRTAEKEGFKKIAVICGAWHAPVLANMPVSAKEDAALLKGLPKVKVQVTWAPWTHSRLSFASGYGAGIESPGWYHHLWTSGDATTSQVVVRWLSRVAKLFRDEDLDASVAHVIEAVRLAETLAALRDRPLPGLAELNEAIQAVFCFGDNLPLQLIQERLIIGELLGTIPEETPMVPLQQELLREQKRLRLPVEASDKELDLDLRKETDLERSYLLHRLALLGIKWGEVQNSGNKKGTFHEIWKLRWQPELTIAIIEAGIWGNTIATATTSRVTDKANKAKELPELTKLVDHTLLANLPEAIDHVMTRLQAQASTTNDVTQLMTALPPLAKVMRYGNVRKTDATLVGHVVDGLVVRICIGLPGACSSLNDDAAEEMFKHILNTNTTINLLQTESYTEMWRTLLQQLSRQKGLHGLIAGRCCRVLFDARIYDLSETSKQLGLALSTANEPIQAAQWIEGFLKESGSVLLHDLELWQILDDWVIALSPEVFNALLPLLRRTFSTFSNPERQQMRQHLKQGFSGQAKLSQLSSQTAENFDTVRAEATLPILAQLLGLKSGVL